MAALVVPQVGQVVIHSTWKGQGNVNVLGVDLSSTSLDEASGQLIADIFAAFYTGRVVGAITPTESLKNLLPADVVLDYIEVIDLDHLGAPAFTYTYNLGVDGAVTAGIANSAGLTNWSGALRLRSARGRNFWGPVGTNRIDDNGRDLQGGVRTNLIEAGQQLIDNLQVNDTPLMVISRTLAAGFTVTNCSVPVTMGTQRRRMRS